MTLPLRMFVWNIMLSNEKTSLYRSVNTYFITILLVLVTSLLSLQVVAKEIDSNQKLLNSCNAFATNSTIAQTQRCVSYIQGFLSATLHINNIKSIAIKKETTIADRAYSTRVGGRSYTTRVGNRGESATDDKKLTNTCPPFNVFNARIIETFSSNKFPPIKTIKHLSKHMHELIKRTCSVKSNEE